MFVSAHSSEQSKAYSNALEKDQPHSTQFPLIHSFTAQIDWPLTCPCQLQERVVQAAFSTPVIFREMSNYIPVYITGLITWTDSICRIFVHL